MRPKFKNLSDFLLSDTIKTLIPLIKLHAEREQSCDDFDKMDYLFVDRDGWYITDSIERRRINDSDDTLHGFGEIYNIVDSPNPYQDNDNNELLDLDAKKIFYKLYKETWDKERIPVIFELNETVNEKSIPGINVTLSSVLEENFNKIDDSIKDLKAKIANHKKEISIWEEEIRKLTVIKTKLK